jgi:hypothetical protein
MLVDHDVVESGGEDYGELYFLTDRFAKNRDAFRQVMAQADIPDSEETTETTTE